MIIDSGLFTHMVLQRNNKNLCDARITGRANTKGKLTLTVRKQRSKGTIRSHSLSVSWKGKKFTARLKGLPLGGPYDISITHEDGSVYLAKDVCVGDLWLLGGQSNMEGCGTLADQEKPHRMVRACYMDDHWDIAEDPIHELHKAIDPVHHILRGGKAEPSEPYLGTGPGVSFALALYEQTNIPQGLIACAHGGTSMAQWDPALKKQRGKSLYGGMIRRFEKAGGKVAGLFWHQGCSDTDPREAAFFPKRCEKLFAAIRRDTKNARLPIVAVQINRFASLTGEFAGWNAVQEHQRLLPKSISRCVVVPTIDLELDDPIHLSGASQCRLGHRAARAMLSLTKEKPGFLPPIELQRVQTKKDPLTGRVNVVATYKNVVGKLIALGQPSGFDFSLSPGTTTGNPPYKTTLKGNQVTISAELPALMTTSCALHYGIGKFPYCNITDEADQSLPVMGPIYIPQKTYCSDPIQTLRVTKPISGFESIEALSYKDLPTERHFKTKTWPSDLCHSKKAFDAAQQKNIAVIYALTFECPTLTNLDFSLGYDGQTKVWLNGKELFVDLHGTYHRPLDKAVIPLGKLRGKHTLHIALSSNWGTAWGIILRFAVPRKKGQAFDPAKAVFPTLLG